MKDYLLTVEYNKPLTQGVFELKLVFDEPLPEIVAGQFLHVETTAKNALLRRPFCIHKWGDNFVVIIVEKKGSGTIELSKVVKGQQLRAILPLGNGFYLDDDQKKVVIVGGGMGCAPLYGIIEAYPDREFHSFLGFRNKECVLFESDFALGKSVSVCTYDGSYGKKGYPVPVFREEIERLKPDVILACGSKSLIRGVKELSESCGVTAYVSLEERMACGVGACLGCTCKAKDWKGEVRNRRVCMDGPIIDVKDLML